VGTLVGVALYLALARLPLTVYLVVLAGLFAVGLWACQEGGRVLGAEDHPGMVFDEIVGFLVTMTAIPPGWQSVILGFALFRLFDITKPWPVSALERKFRGGLGVMLDDVMAGIFALACLHILRHAFNFP
jgi:phosphatidylglycerophosphatase A